MSVVSGQSNGTVEVTPSGIPVYYQSQPKRLYRVGPNPLDTDRLIAIGLSESSELGYLTDDWREVPSVTTVLGALDKPALVVWGERIGAEGVMKLLRAGHLTSIDVPDEAPIQTIMDLLTKHKLRTVHQRNKAGDRGQAVHDALENWARHGHRPDPGIYPEEQEGYVRGLLAFLDDVPSAEPEGAEVLVASAEYGYAGRYDLRLKTTQPHEVVVRRTATRVKKRELKPGRYLADLKTSKNIYASHARQLEAYEQASIESGYEPTDGRGILLVTPDGNYEFRRSWATFADFECVLRVWQSEEEMKQRKNAA